MQNEKRLIDANALMDAFRSYMAERYDRERCVSEENCKTCAGSCLWRKIVSAAPTADAVEVVHGEWIPLEYDGYADGNPVWDLWECSECQEEHSGDEDTLTPYCPNCGAKMDGGNEDV